MNAHFKPMWASSSRRTLDAVLLQAGGVRHANRASGALQVERAAAVRQPRNSPLHCTRLHGQAYVEYLVILLMLLAVFFAGDPDPVDEVMKAVQDAYSRFTYALSLP